MMKRGYVYMLTNKYHRVLYIGVTSNLCRRIYEHKTQQDIHSFTAKYNCTKLVWFTEFPTIKDAIQYEKYLKKKKRSIKISLIEEVNPTWRDLGIDFIS